MIKQEKEQEKKKLTPGKILALILVLALAEPEFAGTLIGIGLVLAPLILLGVVIFRRKKHRAAHQQALENTTFAPCRKEKEFDRKLQSRFCFHGDKAIHHVHRGKEIDPWDRPDVDIRKYQKRR